MSPETMTTSEVMSYLGLASLAAARVQLRRWGIGAVGRALNGEKQWPADQVRAAHAGRPGRGARTDLSEIPREQKAREA